jgi:OOP family OmpA-OmpF porin
MNRAGGGVGSPVERIRTWQFALAIAVAAGCGGSPAPRHASTVPAHTASKKAEPEAPAAEPEAPAAEKKRVEVTDKAIVISDKIQFAFDRSAISSESFSLLDEIVDTIKSHPEIRRVSIEGYASTDGQPAFNKRLAAKRARLVMAYLVSHGIAKQRLSARGMGTDHPIADNSTEDGREQNRRVEFHIVDAPDAPDDAVVVSDDGDDE